MPPIALRPVGLTTAHSPAEQIASPFPPWWGNVRGEIFDQDMLAKPTRVFAVSGDAESFDLEV